jgi:hypothetical protein
MQVGHHQEQLQIPGNVMPVEQHNGSILTIELKYNDTFDCTEVENCQLDLNIPA